MYGTLGFGRVSPLLWTAECISKNRRFFTDYTLEFSLVELNGYKLYKPFASIGARRNYSSVKFLSPCGGSLVSITSESSWELDCGTHDVVVGIRTWLQVDGNVSDKLASGLPHDKEVKTFLIRGPGTAECTRHETRGNGEECVD